MVKYTEKTQRKIAEFMEGMRHDDYSNSFQFREQGAYFEYLNKEFKEIFAEIKRYRKEKQEGYYFLQTLLQHLKVGVLAFTQDGQVDMVNTATKRIFQLNHIKEIEELSVYDANLPNLLRKMKNEETQLLKINIGDTLMQLSMFSTWIQVGEKSLKLISFYNIQSELEEQEIDSWQKLIRVVTHEIMNSITPITSLASTINSILIDDEGKALKSDQIDNESLDIIQEAMQTIERRSRGLQKFVEEYRSFSRIPKPAFRYMQVDDLLNRVLSLLENDIRENKIRITLSVIPRNLQLTLDPDLIEQVFINLLLNAIDALKGIENPEITIHAVKNDNGRVVISIKDNGKGIPVDMLEKIFIPFFTSKEEGSGIGLSLSRQIMHLHKGKIQIKSVPFEYTHVSLTF